MQDKNLNRKNIAIIVPTLKNGGAERIASNLSLSIPKDYKIHIIVNETSDGDYPYRGTLHNLKSKSYNNILLKAFSIINRTIQVKKIKKANNIKISISFLTASNFVNVFSKSGDKTILTIHSIMSKVKNVSLYQIIKNLLIRRLYVRADEIVAVSEGAKLSLVRNYKLDDGLVSVINNIFDISRIQELSKESLSNVDSQLFEAPVIVNVGRLSKVKGQWSLIRAFKKIKEQNRDARLIFLGTGELENELKNLVKELELESSVKFIGFTNNPYKYLSKSTIFVSSSTRESFGNAIIEAMACETPVISTDCVYGPREILYPNSDIELRTDSIEYAPYGILSPVSDNYVDYYDPELTTNETLLAESIIQLLSNETKKEHYKNKGLIRARDFASDMIIEKWIELFEG